MSREWSLDRWTPWSQPAVPMLLCLTLTPSFEPLRRRLGRGLFTSVILFEAGEGTWVYRQTEAVSLGEHMCDFLGRPGALDAFADELEVATHDLDLRTQQVPSSYGQLTAQQTLDEFTKLQAAYNKFYSLGAFVEPVQEYVQRVVGTRLADVARQSEMSIPEVTEHIYVDRFDSFALERMMQLSDAIGSGALAEFDDKFWWSKNNYFRCRIATREDTSKELEGYGTDAADAIRAEVVAARARRDHLLAGQRQVRAFLSEQERRLLMIHDLVGSRLVDVRKRLVMQTNGHFSALLRQLETQLRLELSTLDWLVPEELAQALQEPRWAAAAATERRKVVVVFQSDLDLLMPASSLDLTEPLLPATPMTSPEIAGGSQAEELLLDLDSVLGFLRTTSEERTPLRGHVASRGNTAGKVCGRVVVVRDPSGSFVRDDEILVASSTTPDFVPLMRSAKAIVTDWGGQTSHAAITARELGLPCIVGTHRATTELSTGDAICIDLESGAITRTHAEP